MRDTRSLRLRLGAIPRVFYWYNSYEWLRFKVEKNSFKSQLLKKISKKFKLKSEKLRIVKKKQIVRKMG